MNRLLRRRSSGRISISRATSMGLLRRNATHAMERIYVASARPSRTCGSTRCEPHSHSTGGKEGLDGCHEQAGRDECACRCIVCMIRSRPGRVGYRAARRQSVGNISTLQHRPPPRGPRPRDIISLVRPGRGRRGPAVGWLAPRAARGPHHRSPCQASHPRRSCAGDRGGVKAAVFRGRVRRRDWDGLLMGGGGSAQVGRRRGRSRRVRRVKQAQVREDRAHDGRVLHRGDAPQPAATARAGEDSKGEGSPAPILPEQGSQVRSGP